jgi:hypothetical protein
LQNGHCSFTGRKRSDYFEETSLSEDSCLVIDTDVEQHNNPGSNNVQGHQVDYVMAKAQNPEKVFGYRRM